MPYRLGRTLYLCVGASRSSITSPFRIVNYSFTHSDFRVSCSEVVHHQYLLGKLSGLVHLSRNPRMSIAVSQAMKPNDRTKRDSTILGHGGSTGQRQRGRRKDSASEHTVCQTPISLFIVMVPLIHPGDIMSIIMCSKRMTSIFHAWCDK